jgi:hypothetical protein
MRGKSGVKANRPTPIATVREIMPAVAIVKVDRQAAAVEDFTTRHFFQAMESKVTSFSSSGYKHLNYE